MSGLWGSDKRVVAMTGEDVNRLVSAIVEGIAKDHQSEFMDHLKQSAGQQAELTRLRDDLSRMEREMALHLAAKDQEIVRLRAHIDQLNGLLTSMGPGALASSPYNGALTPTVSHPLPVYPERYTASVPVPPPMSAPPAQDPYPAGS